MMRWRIAWVIPAVCLVFPLWAQEIPLAPNHPTQYTVITGDTLWDIAGKFLRHPWQWPSIWNSNRHIRNPHLIYPGDLITLDFVNGRPRLSLGGGSRLADGHAGVTKLAPAIRETALAEPIPVIPPEAIAQFLTRPEVVDRETLRQAPYVVQLADDHLVGGAGDRIYARAIAPHDRNAYVLFHPGKPFIDPETQAQLGVEAIYVGTTRTIQTGDPATLLLLSTDREVTVGDRLLVVNHPALDLTYFPQPPEQPVSGRVLRIKDGLYESGQYQIVTINRGRRDGLKEGHLLTIWHRGYVVHDYVTPVVGSSVKLPDEVVGHLMVFWPLEHLSYAVVLTSRLPVRVGDIVSNATEDAN